MPPSTLEPTLEALAAGWLAAAHRAFGVAGGTLASVERAATPQHAHRLRCVRALIDATPRNPLQRPRAP